MIAVFEARPATVSLSASMTSVDLITTCSASPFLSALSSALLWVIPAGALGRAAGISR